MRILVISNLFPDRKQPTFGTFMRSHVDALGRAGADVELVAIRGVGVHTRVARKYLRLFADATRAVLWSALRRRRPQIIEAHIAYPTGVIAWPLARLIRAKLVLYVHGTDAREVGQRSRQHRFLSRLVFHRADLVVANSCYTRSLLLDLYGVADERILVWSPGIDTDLFRPLPYVQRDSRRVLYVGRLDSEKGIDILIRAMAQLADSQLDLRIVGAGPQLEMVQQLSVELGLSVTFTGGLEPAEVAREMAGAGILVVPSMYEALGLVALEGMASGAIVIASATGGLIETIDDGVNGFLVPRGDAQALAACIRHATDLLHGEDDGVHRVVVAARERATSHDINAVARNSLATYSRFPNAAPNSGERSPQ